jgi:diadenosine tetraphosphate (Ap4A) HIT family hydrolase
MTTLEELIADSWFPFAGDITVKPLDDPVVPEPVRAGVEPGSCLACARPDSDYVWTDERWRLTPYLPTQIPGIVLLESRAHHDSFVDLPPDLLAEVGPLTARVERVLMSLGDVARVHVNRWGDGSAHFHLWFMPRPLGVLQLRGSMLPMWLDVLPDLDEAEARDALVRVATGMAAGGGTAQYSAGGGTAQV